MITQPSNTFHNEPSNLPPDAHPAACLVIAGTHSGVGKTSVATALMSAYRRRGLRVQGFKIGPDFIDPGYHRLATGRASHNLDGWMLHREANQLLFARAARGADLCIVEGMMGLFDGRSADSEEGSTAQIAKWLGAPVVLVVDGSAMARSAAALVLGFESFDPELPVAGAIFNRVSGAGHFAYLRDSLGGHCRATPVGYLEPDPSLALPERHLGLHLAHEVLTGALLSRMADWVERSLNLDELLAIARRADPVTAADSAPNFSTSSRARIAIAHDNAFQFYYQDNLDRLRAAGAQLVPFSPLHDAQLPGETSALYLGGGYPELHGAALAANRSMRDSVRHFARNGGAILAECGGFLYLTEALIDAEGRQHAMCGLFPTVARMQSSLQGFGYAELTVAGPGSGWLPAGLRLRGHEFRHSSLVGAVQPAVRVFHIRQGDSEREDGFCLGNVIASYFHLHFGSCPAFAPALVAAAERFTVERLTA